MKIQYFKTLVILFLLISMNGFCQFKAIMIFTANNQQREMKIYSYEGKYRYEFNADGQEGIVISKQGSDLVYILMPQQKMAMKSKIGSPMAMGNDPVKSYEYYQKKGQKVDLDKETINGIICDKFELRNDKSEEYVEAKQKMFTVWVSEKYNFPVKIINHMDASGTNEMELKNIEAWTPVEGSFSIPDDYQTMEM